MKTSEQYHPPLGITGAYLRLRWEKSSLPDCDWLCHYELVIPFRDHDIRREVYDKNGEQIAELFCNIVSMGSPTKRTCKTIPCSNDNWDAPYRGGAHASFDSEQLGNIPVIVMAPCGRCFSRPTAPITGPPGGVDKQNGAGAAPGASTC